MNKLKKNLTDEPLIRLVKRDALPWWKSALFYIGAIVLALIMGGIFIVAIGKNPFLFYQTVFTGSFENSMYITLLLRTFIPLLITSLGIAVAFKMRFWNIGAEGQFLMGAIIACTVSLAMGDKFPPAVTVIVVVLCGAISGGLYGVITAVLKVRFGTNETLLTLMLNYIVLYLIYYFVKLPFYKVPTGGFPTFKPLPESSWLTEINMGGVIVDTGFFIGVILIVLAFLYFNFTKHGYEISVVGDSPNTARYAGMSVKKVIIRTMFLSSFLIGLAGALQLTGSSSSHTMSSGLTGGVGWTGIIVAWLAKLNPIAIAVVSFLMAILEKGCSVARATYNISAAVADILQGIILFSVLAFDFFIRFKIIIRNRKTKMNIQNDTIASDVTEKQEEVTANAAD